MSKPIGKIIMAKFPHLANQKETIQNLKKYLELLQKRLVLIDSDKQEKSDFQKNEDEILVWRTKKDLAKGYGDLSKREQQFKEYYDKMSKMIPEVNANFEATLKKAKSLSDQSKDLADEIQMFKTYDLEANHEARIHFYGGLKSKIELIENPAPMKVVPNN
jgi:hypothetical protein